LRKNKAYVGQTIGSRILLTGIVRQTHCKSNWIGQS
jgi:hypothetical protein